MKKLFSVLVLFVISFLVASPLIASTSSGMPWEDPLNKIMASLSGPVPKIIGIIMIVGAGLMIAFTEGQAIKQAMWVCVGLGIALNAASFLTMLFGNASGFLW